MKQTDKTAQLDKLKNHEYKNKTEIIEIVKQIVQPQVNEALMKLIKKLEKIQVVQSYTEKVHSQKIQDKKEQKKHEKERLKFELGSEYESSEESNIMDDYVTQITYFQIFKQEDPQKQNDFSDNDENNDDPDKNMTVALNKDIQPVQQIAQIREEEDVDDEDHQLTQSKNRNRFLEHKVNQFNPLQYLGLALKEIIGQPITFNKQILESQQSQLPEEIEVKEQCEPEQPQVLDTLSEIITNT